MKGAKINVSELSYRLIFEDFRKIRENIGRQGMKENKGNRGNKGNEGKKKTPKKGGQRYIHESEIFSHILISLVSDSHISHMKPKNPK